MTIKELKEHIQNMEDEGMPESAVIMIDNNLGNIITLNNNYVSWQTNFEDSVSENIYPHVFVMG